MLNTFVKRGMQLAGAVALAGWVGFASAEADLNKDASAELQGLLSSFNSLSAEFEQVSVAGDSRRTEQSRGELVVAKPDRFSWLAKEPFPQEIISDGEYIWIYDPDLEQATRKKADQQNAGVPALILNGQVDELKETYKIRLIHEESDNQLFELLPKSDQEIFTRVRLLFTKGVIAELQLEDSLGQRSSVQFFEQQLNPVISESQFRFDVPEGTDVMYDHGTENGIDGAN